jgi:hypothetical protein
MADPLRREPFRGQPFISAVAVYLGDKPSRESLGGFPPWRCRLLFLLNMQGVLAKLGAVLVQLQFLASGTTIHCVVVITGLLAYEKDGLFFLFAFGHGFGRSNRSAIRRKVKVLRTGIMPTRALIRQFKKSTF